MSDWETAELWRKHIERQLYELGALVRGQVPTVSSRLADVLEQVDELRQELKAVHERLEKMSEWAKAHSKKNGGTSA